jgi:hypothetical protein
MPCREPRSFRFTYYVKRNAGAYSGCPYLQGLVTQRSAERVLGGVFLCIGAAFLAAWYQGGGGGHRVQV